MKIKNIISFLVIIFLGTSAFPQPNMKNRRAEIQKQKIEFVKQKLQLTAEEQKTFLPVYNEFEKKQLGIIKKKHLIFRNFRQNRLNFTEEALVKMTNDLSELNTSEAQLFAEYNKKFNDVLPAKKVMLLYISEHEFKKELIKNFNKRPPPRR